MYKINEVINNNYIIKGIVEYQNNSLYLAYSSSAKCRVELFPVNDTENLSEISSVLGSIKNEALPYVYDVFTNEEQTYIAFEAPCGSNLSEALEKGRRLEWREAVKSGIKMLSVCSYLHNELSFPVIHGNISKFTVFDISGKLMITDIELSTLLKLKEVKYSEQLKNAFQSDISSIGRLIYLVITGEELQNEKNSAAVIPPKLMKIINKAIGKETEQYNSASEMAEELTKLLNFRKNAVKYSFISAIPICCILIIAIAFPGKADSAPPVVIEGVTLETSVRPPPEKPPDSERRYHVEEIPQLGMDDIKYYGDGNDYGSSEDEDYVIIGGEKYKSSVSVLDLRNKGLSDNDITTLAEFKKLKALYLDGNNISDLTVIGHIDTLNDLWLDKNNIADVSPLACLTNLKRLTVNDNKITDISALSSLTELDQLCIQANNIENISAVSSMSKLTKLMMNINNISDLSPLEKITGLEQLYADKCGISDISALHDLGSLKILYLNNNEISDITPLENCLSLQMLSIRSNKILEGAAISELVSLKSLDISENSLDSMDFAYNLTSLTYLSVSANNITDIGGISALVNMEELFLRNNPILDASEIKALPNLKIVSLVQCGLSDAELEQLNKDLPRVRFLSSYN